MNSIFTKSALLVVAALSMATFSARASTNATAKISSKAVLKAIDDICGDTWCGSDFDFKFNSLKITNQKAVLQFEMFLNPADKNNTHYARTCEIEGISALSDAATLNKSVTGNSYVTLNEDFYTNLTTCIDKEISALDAQLFPAPVK